MGEARSGTSKHLVSSNEAGYRVAVTPYYQFIGRSICRQSLPIAKNGGARIAMGILE